jgi:DNA-binding HxlR family transcriptional regulator
MRGASVNRREPSQRFIGLIDERWTLVVLAQLQEGGRRCQELDAALDVVSHVKFKGAVGIGTKGD